MSHKEEKEKKKKYYLADNDKIQKKLEEIGSGTFFKPKEGKNIIRILPPWSKEGVWYKEATLHYGLTTESGKEKAFPCLKMFGKECPVCNKKDELMQGDAEDKKLADKLRPRSKYYTNILDRKSGQVMIWGFSAKTLGILLSYASDPDYGDISHPEEGFDVVIERVGTTRTDTKYQIRLKPKPTPVSDDDDWADKMHNLDTEIITEIEEDELQEILDSSLGEEVSKKKKKKPSDDEDDDDDDDDEDEDKPKKKKKPSDDDDDEDKPKKKKGKEDDDDDDEDDED